MSTERRERQAARRGRRRRFLVESLENRQLLATATVTGPTFVSPSLSGLIGEANRGVNTGPAVIDTMLSALQTQLTNGPLADLNSAAVDGSGFVTESQDLVSSYSQSVDQQLSPRFTHIDQILQLQGQRIVADLASLNQQETVGIITSTSSLSIAAGGAIAALTAGPIVSLETPISAYVTTTQSFETNLSTLVASLNSSGTPSLTLSQVNTTFQAEAEAYRTDMNAGLLVTHPNIAATVGTAVTTLEDTVNTIAADNSATALSQLHTAIAQFDTAILDTTGLFGTMGLVTQESASTGYIAHNLTNKPASTTLASVSGTGTFGGTATLTATLTSSSGAAVVGRIVSFTLDGVYAGTALTDSDGVATLSGVSTTDAAGTTTGAVVASFAGDINYKPTQATGDITNSQSATALNSVSGTATYGGATGSTATLTATLTSTTTSQPISGQTVTFTLDGTSVGSATTVSSGVATLSSVATTDAVGTHTGVVGASFAGTSNYTASSGTGDLVVSQASTTTTLVSSPSTSVSGQSVTFTATVAASSSGAGTPTGTVNFLDGTTTIGTDIALNSSGVATIATSTLTAGTHSITAVYSGDTNFTTSTGSLTQTVVVAPTVTALSPTSGSTEGGLVVTITGTGFIGALRVHFGTTAQTELMVVNSTTMRTLSPAGTGTVDVTVTTPGGTSATSADDKFTYT